MFTDTPAASARRQAWAYLSAVVEGPNPYLLAQLWDDGNGGITDTPSPIAVAERIHTRDPNLPPELLRSTASRYDTCNPRDDLARAAAAGARLVTPEDAEWPGQAFATSFALSRASQLPKGNQIDCVAPHALWVKGKPLNTVLNDQRSVTIVGTRASTRYGDTTTREIARDLSAKGWTIVSGGALGIDRAAHMGALDATGLTLAVLACGVDYSYPVAHRELFADIATSGCLVSEYPPGTPPARHRFLTRNRVAAAFGSGVLVVESGARSGALNTVSWAESMTKTILAVPGPVTSRSSCGPHRLIHSGRAILVENADDVIRSLSSLEALGEMALDSAADDSTGYRLGGRLGGRAGRRRTAKGDLDEYAQPMLDVDIPIRIAQTLRGADLKVWDALGNFGCDAMSIGQTAGLDMAAVMNTLCRLRDDGIVVRKGNRWLRVEDETRAAVL